MDNQYLLTELKNFLDEEGKLKAYPTKKKQKILALFYLVAKFKKGKRYSEKEVNEILKCWHTFEDWAMLRRELYDNWFFGREADGSVYWLEDEQPTIESIGL